MSPLLHHALVGFIVLNVVIGMVTYVTLLERKFAARMQSRIGPYYVGPHGLLQPIADALKLMMKEDVVPAAADRWVYNLAPLAFLVPCVLIFATIPFAPGLGVADLNIGVLGPLAFVAFLVATLAAENRVPFDILEAESELVAGFRVEYSGMKFALIQLAEYAHMIATSFLGALLFLGGWLGPGPAALGPVWFLLKAM
ncbi:MAG: NADH-quinone oxidoreductase subunit H, partial [Candidatus Rokuibacteriota bacterium]